MAHASARPESHRNGWHWPRAAAHAKASKESDVIVAVNSFISSLSITWKNRLAVVSTAVGAP
jgi:hypothetical protein